MWPITLLHRNSLVVFNVFLVEKKKNKHRYYDMKQNIPPSIQSQRRNGCVKAFGDIQFPGCKLLQKFRSAHYKVFGLKTTHLSMRQWGLIGFTVSILSNIIMDHYSFKSTEQTTAHHPDWLPTLSNKFLLLLHQQMKNPVRAGEPRSRHRQHASDEFSSTPETHSIAEQLCFCKHF